ncbi:MAG: FAD-dependent oxidoreductase [Pseudomonadota bacterium]|nr:FAD-dependent oxidoreductase [Pseudomonadota bacterium]
MSAGILGKQAVVIGAGIAGLTAARVLADHFEKVTVLERDSLPTTAANRAGTPQARHVHGLMTGGLIALSELFPDFESVLESAGAVPLRSGLDVRIERPGFDPFPMRDLEIRNFAISRSTLEFAVRQCTLKHTNISLESDCRVTGIVTGEDGSLVEGVNFHGADRITQMLPADLVIDASGRGAPTLAVLKSTGRAAPTETTIGVDVGYSTAIYEIPDDAPRDWKGVMTFPAMPQSSRGGLLLPIEGKRWMLSLGGRDDDKPPGDEAGFLDFARQLRTPTIYNAIRDATRVGDIVRYVFPQSIRRHFELIQKWPRGLIPMGDSICQFNPLYAQGMSVAAMEAVLLRRLLVQSRGASDPLAMLAPTFFAEVNTLLETPWIMAAIPDFIFPTTVGQRPADLQRNLRFAAALTRLAARKPDVHKLMMEVQGLVKPRSVYRRPMFMARILLEMVRGA